VKSKTCHNIVEWLRATPMLKRGDDVTISVSVTLPFEDWKIFAAGAKFRGETIDETVTAMVSGEVAFRFEDDGFQTYEEKKMAKEKAAIEADKQAKAKGKAKP
jgi:hypothetical protein